MPTRPLRWWIVDTFTGRGSGKRTRASGERFTKVMSGLSVGADVEIPDRLGSGKSRRVSMTFARPRDFRISDVVDAVDDLKRLKAAADALARDRSATAQTAIDRVGAIIGKGALTGLLAVEFGPEPEEESAPPPPSGAPPTATGPEPPAATTTPPDAPATPSEASGDEPNSLDAIFGRASMPTQTQQVIHEAKTGVAAFMEAVTQNSRKRRASNDPHREPAANTIRAAVDAAACDVLDHPLIADLERAWRGVRTVVSVSPGHDDLGIELVDVARGSVASALSEVWPTSPDERPDVVFVGVPCTDAYDLAALGEVAEQIRRPIVVGVTDELAGPIARGEEGDPGPNWPALGAMVGARWLCAVANSPLLATEKTAGGPPRVVPGSPALGLAALIAGCVDRTAPIPRSVTGPQHAFVAPAAHDIELQAGEVRTIATERYASIPRQQDAAQRGITLLGGPVGSDRIVVVATPTLDGGSLLARMGEAVR